MTSEKTLILLEQPSSEQPRIYHNQLFKVPQSTSQKNWQKFISNFLSNLDDKQTNKQWQKHWQKKMILVHQMSIKEHQNEPIHASYQISWKYNSHNTTVICYSLYLVYNSQSDIWNQPLGPCVQCSSDDSNQHSPRSAAYSYYKNNK